MRKTKFNLFALLLIFSTSIGFYACSDSEDDPTPKKEDSEIVSKIVSNNYIELDKIEKISRFRSGEGHDYSDSNEKCRSMKHYFKPKEGIDASEIQIFSPIDGEIAFAFEEEVGGTQIYIRATNINKDLYFVIFHVNLKEGITEGTKVSAGENIGNHIGNQTWSDIAVCFGTEENNTLYSYFDFLTDDLFAQYKARGVESRGALIITKDERDADPLRLVSEDSEEFVNSGTIENWVKLN
jgi:hypothetical protein